MNDTHDSFASFSALLREALGDRLAAEAATFTQMMAEDSVMDFPYAPPGMVTRLEGRAAIERHLASLVGLIQFDRMIDLVVHRTEGDTFVLEFGCTGHGVQTGVPYPQRYISVITLENGRIARYRDYWNPLVVLEAMGQPTALAAEARAR